MLDVLGFYHEQAGGPGGPGGPGPEVGTKFMGAGADDEDDTAAEPTPTLAEAAPAAAVTSPPPGGAAPPPAISPRPDFTKSEKTKPISKPKPSVPMPSKPPPPKSPPPPGPAAGGDAGKAVQKRDRGKKKMSDEEVLSRLREIISPGVTQERYVSKEKIGQGASGTVVTAVDKVTGNTVAIKQMNLQQQPKKVGSPLDSTQSSLSPL